MTPSTFAQLACIAPVTLVLIATGLLMYAAPVSALLKIRRVQEWRLPRSVKWVIIQAAVTAVWMFVLYLCGSVAVALGAPAGGF